MSEHLPVRLRVQLPVTVIWLIMMYNRGVGKNMIRQGFSDRACYTEAADARVMLPCRRYSISAGKTTTEMLAHVVKSETGGAEV